MRARTPSPIDSSWVSPSTSPLRAAIDSWRRSMTRASAYRAPAARAASTAASAYSNMTENVSAANGSLRLAAGQSVRPGPAGNAAAGPVRGIRALDRLLPGHLGDARRRPLPVGRDDPLLRLERDADRRHEVAAGQAACLAIEREAGLGAMERDGHVRGDDRRRARAASQVDARRRVDAPRRRTAGRRPLRARAWR